MKQKLNKFYLNKNTFIVSSIIAFVGYVIWGINYLTVSKFSNAIGAFIFAAFVAMLFVAYKKGKTNLQKMLLGGLLTYMLFDFLSLLVGYLQQPYLTTVITWVLNSIFIVIIYISYMRQQMDHKGASVSIVVNQLCGVLIIGAFLRQLIHFYENYITLPTILWTISSTATYIFIISIGTRINEYKKVRSAKKDEGCWTEEERQKAKKIFSI